jgi:iron complex outermembrane recepter protein
VRGVEAGVQHFYTDGFVTAINVLGEGYNELADSITWRYACSSGAGSDPAT